ncbi:sorbosone dehydrogenase family protein [Bacteriovorax sp. PP10]|uniref:Sorbosone dehydrogenase family protein n=1 Tax=Bacteriovorax antarcticus TaxID=3088717 RepID=A0ABU5VYH6_9BACT|nr:sorbosone dehydrogenase family protein [Bacteriovorax sp. PP10]MEA9357413.1 sorbosone dehydrogenase family protein [Bacteriovorax sp. PP10]
MKWKLTCLPIALFLSSISFAADINLPAPDEKSSVKNYSKVIGWPAGKMPVAPQGFKVSKFANNLQSPRWIYALPNGDVLIAEAKTEEKNPIKKVGAMVSGASKSGNKGDAGNRITLFRDANGDGTYELRESFLTDLKQPFGMLLLRDSFYVANSDSLWRYPYKTGETKITGQGEKILDLPADGRHWTKNIIANADGSKIYVAIGSASDHAEDGIEKEKVRARIIEINPDGSGFRVYASGLRNPVGMGWSGGKLWTAVNERDELGNDLVPDYLTEVKENGFYGWPYSYWGDHMDPRLKGAGADQAKNAIIPNVSLGAHTASLGLAFYDKNLFPVKYHNGAFIGQHGSWNRAVLSGYKVVFVPFKNGKPSGEPEDFLVGFVSNLKKSEVYGRPVGVTVLNDGSILVADDVSNTVWKVTHTNEKITKR